jgi:hypothetical protein
VAARAGVALAVGHRRQRRDLRVRREAYLEVDPVMGHDLRFPFNMVKRGWRAVYAPRARATEKMVPTIEGEFARKRRMMSHAGRSSCAAGCSSPRGYPPLYALMIAQPPAAALRDAVPAPRRARATLALLGAARLRARRRAQARCSPPRSRRRRRPRSSRATTC